MKQIKHSKFRNTGFLFELLVRQVTSDILANRKSIAEGLLKKYFNSKTELANELKLYQFIVNEKYNNENRAERFIDAVIEPQETRHQIVKALNALRNKRVALPPRKHGNIPL